MDSDPETVPDDFDQFDANLSLKEPIIEYKRLIDERIKITAFVPTEMGYLIWDKISAGAREAIWKLLFDNANPAEEHLQMAAEFLKVHRADARHYSPSEYNVWIPKVRDELLKRGMLAFWKNEIVANELGPAWARDSDFYDDMEDPEPANFYKYGGCEAAWLKENQETQVYKNPETVPDDFDQFDATLSLKEPIKDYLQLVEEKMRVDALVPNEMCDRIWDKISAGARDAVWKLLFDNTIPTEEHLKMASELLKLHKDDACFYSPFEYNDWIVNVRDELLKREMLAFWKNEIVAKELGPAWSRDSDLYDEPDDPEPEKFYKYAGCEAAWLKKPKNELLPATSLNLMTFEAIKSPKTTKALKKISSATPLEDYKYNMEVQADTDPDDDEAYKQIFSQVREIIWILLFGETDLIDDNMKKASALLEVYKRDACFYSPYDYNVWILKVRNELFERKYFDFWQQVIVDKELGLCWAKDSDYFDDMKDPKPLQFYESGIDVMKHVEKK